MTSTDAVIGAEALLGRHLTNFEMKLVLQIVGKQLDFHQTWDEISEVLGVKTSDVVRLLIMYRVRSAGSDYDATARVLREDTELRMKRAGLGANL